MASALDFYGCQLNTSNSILNNTMSPYLHYTYLLVLFFTVIICFLFSYHKKIKFHLHFNFLLPSIGMVAIPFIVWDIIFTNEGIWWFDHTYTIGTDIINLPIEEWMFFVCIPFSCMFTYFCLDKFFNWSWTKRYNKIFQVLYFLLSISVMFYFKERDYPFYTFLFNAIFTIFTFLIIKTDLVFKIFSIYICLLPGFLLVNGVLTGSFIPSPVVNYNPSEIINLRIKTIPIEDLAYGFLLFQANVLLFKEFSTKANSNL